jgi:uncharacterized protein (DUF58 family)
MAEDPNNSSLPTEILRQVRRLEISTRKVVNNILAGQYHSAFKGQGMQFADFREYHIGDDVRHIDWNASARTGTTLIKKYDEVEVAALMAFSAIKNNDRVGLILFTDQVEEYIPPKKGRKHVLRLIRDLLYFHPKSSRTNIADALQFLNKVQKRRAVVLLISDFLDKGFEKQLRVAGQRHDVIAVNISDPKEYDIPPIGLVNFTDPETGASQTIDTSNYQWQKKFAQEVQKQRHAKEEALRKSGIDIVNIDTHSSYSDALSRFFKRRKIAR